MDTPVQQESPQSHARQYSAPPMQQPQMYAATPLKHNSLGPGSMSMAMRAEMPTILETNSQPAPEPRSMQYARPAGQEGSQPAAWNPTNSWLPTSAPALNQPGSLTGPPPSFHALQPLLSSAVSVTSATIAILCNQCNHSYHALQPLH